MPEKYSCNIKDLIDEFSLEPLYLPPGESIIYSMDLNRPGLALTGFTGHFDNKRVQIFGRSEHQYLEKLPPDVRIAHIENFMTLKPPALIYSASLVPSDGLIDCAKKYHIPVLRSADNTSDLFAMVLSFLHVRLAPRITRHGVFVEVYGEGILILGDSGIGKSETAIELVKRGHRLIADDAVEIKKVSAKTLVGSAPELIKYYAELRGIGIIDVRRIFGVGAVKDTEKVDMIINLEPWVQGKMYDRIGGETEHIEIMGIKIPMTTIPVKPGRNLAVIIEIAAMNNRQRRMGYNTAEEFNKKLIESMQAQSADDV